MTVSVIHSYIHGARTNTDSETNTANFQFFAEKGITLSNYVGVTHPSEPNYLASAVGDYFGMQNDDFLRTDLNVSSVIDLLEDKGISWAYYQEDMPYSGYEGYEWKNQETGANDYVRKHNPGVIPDTNTHYEQRLSQIKNLSMIDTERSMFHKDLKEDKLPQWMFVTPNMTSDGHDTDIMVAGEWLSAWLKPIMHDPKFMRDTLVVITFDENETYTIQNRIFSILLGDVVPKHLEGTTDDTFYNHYSEISTVEANWDLHTLGRWDVGANVYKMVAEKTGDRLREWRCSDDLEDRFYNQSYAGPFNTDGGNQQYIAPNLKLDHAKTHRRTILPAIKKIWEHTDLPTYYEDTIEIPDGLNPPKGYEVPA